MPTKIPKATIAMIEQVTGLTVKGAEKEDFARYDGFLYYKDEWRHIIEVKNRGGRYTLEWFISEGTVSLDTSKVRNLQFLSQLHAVKATLFIQTADEHLIVFKITNKKGEYIMPVDDQRLELQPINNQSKQKEYTNMTHLNVDDSTIYEFKE